MCSMNRREMLKLGCAGSLAAITSTVPGVIQSGVGEVAHSAVPQWEVFELRLAGPDSGNPFTEVQLGARFVLGRKFVAVDGFYDGTGTYKIRFMPDTEGEWTYTTSSNAPQLDGKVGRFACVAALQTAHGPVVVRNQHHFAYADGTPYFP